MTDTTCYIEDVEFDSIEDIISGMEHAMNTYLTEKCEETSSINLGLDPRCGTCWVDTENNAIIVPSHNLQSFRYYGGFEYVSDDAVTTLGRYTIFNSMYGEEQRIQDALDLFAETDE